MIEKIIQGDCISELKKLDNESIDLIFADPPYFMQTSGKLLRPEGAEFKGCDDEWDKFNNLTEYRNFTLQWLKECQRVLKKDGSIWVIGSMQCIYLIGATMQELGFWLINDVIWQKSNPTPNFLGTRLNNSHETLIWAAKSKSSKFAFNYKTAKELNSDVLEPNLFKKGERRQLGSVWKIPVCSGNERLKDKLGNKLHNTQKPEILLYRIIAISSKMGDVVLDPFGGTMTTAAMAKKLGRGYISIEKDERYIHYGKKRISQIEFENSDIANAKWDKKPPKADMKDMIKAGFFISGETFYLNGSKATLLDDGKLEFNTEKYDMHSLAAKIKKTKTTRLNGFKYWKVLRNNELIGIDLIRQKYRDVQ
ncbi:DNA methyltransferase [Campylobacter sp. 19-13652]|uniref:site-specific DNA-methyltransferase n=1 Tax=Campylobacter sp. 19-13652 TaxID=2840180 RepID=UPI001C770779|nr:DNA methyltransferase [Campylobacter sp. 19-13652]BCX79605.1 methyltransferase [Campylobacter sp. 19-13652]